ncbi:MAG: alpha/beta hydrolase [Prochloraceae cyanobacterium]|nr:alpha/beta hydrolase [Prochloraceae cyanobacterium]
MSTIEVRGVQHYYEWIRQQQSDRDKPIMVFVHGWGGSSQYWQSIARLLSDRFDCLLYDLRGFGRSLKGVASQDFSYELEEYARDLAIFLDNLHIDRKIYLNSHSMGGSIGVLFANLYPDKVEKSIVNCNGIFEYDKRAFAIFHQFGKYVVQFRYKWFLKVPFMERLFMARFLSRPIPPALSKIFLSDFIVADYEAALKTIYSSVNKETVEVMPKEFARIQVPTLLITGEKDRIIPAKMGKAAAALNDSIGYEEVAGTGHFPMLEDTKTYLKLVKNFLEIN